MGPVTIRIAGLGTRGWKSPGPLTPRGDLLKAEHQLRRTNPELTESSSSETPRTFRPGRFQTLGTRGWTQGYSTCSEGRGLPSVNSMASRLTKSASLQPLTWSHSNVGFLITRSWKPAQAFWGPDRGAKEQSGPGKPGGSGGGRGAAWRMVLWVGRSSDFFPSKNPETQVLRQNLLISKCWKSVHIFKDTGRTKETPLEPWASRGQRCPLGGTWPS